MPVRGCHVGDTYNPITSTSILHDRRVDGTIIQIPQALEPELQPYLTVVLISRISHARCHAEQRVAPSRTEEPKHRVLRSSHNSTSTPLLELLGGEKFRRLGSPDRETGSKSSTRDLIFNLTGWMRLMQLFCLLMEPYRRANAVGRRCRCQYGSLRSPSFGNRKAGCMCRSLSVI